MCSGDPGSKEEALYALQDGETTKGCMQNKEGAHRARVRIENSCEPRGSITMSKSSQEVGKPWAVPETCCS